MFIRILRHSLHRGFANRGLSESRRRALSSIVYASILDCTVSYSVYMYTYIYIYIYIHTHTYVYIYMYRERD